MLLIIEKVKSSAISMKQYRCTFIAGDYTENDSDLFFVKETPQTITFIPVDAFDKNKISYRCPKDNTGKHCLKIWDDGSYTLYPFRSGTPHIFEPIS